VNGATGKGAATGFQKWLLDIASSPAAGSENDRRVKNLAVS
jgi:hypothetical protein